MTPTPLDKLEGVGLYAMAAALREQPELAPQYGELSFEDRVGLLVDREVDWRDSRRLSTRLKAAKLRHAATVDIDFRAPRGLDRGVILRLAQGNWVTQRHNVLITGAIGCGKSFCACALAHAAIRQVRKGEKGIVILAPVAPRIRAQDENGDEQVISGTAQAFATLTSSTSHRRKALTFRLWSSGSKARIRTVHSCA